MVSLKSPKAIQEQLKTATQRKDKPYLERLILECEACKYPELAYDLRDARQALNNLGGGYGGQHFLKKYINLP